MHNISLIIVLRVVGLPLEAQTHNVSPTIKHSCAAPRRLHRQQSGSAHQQRVAELHYDCTALPANVFGVDRHSGVLLRCVPQGWARHSAATL